MRRLSGMCVSIDVPIFAPGHNEPAEWETLNVLIGHIYDSILQPERWNETLARITGTLCPLSWEAAFILWESSSPPRARFVAATGSRPGSRKSTPPSMPAITHGRAS